LQYKKLSEKNYYTLNFDLVVLLEHAKFMKFHPKSPNV